MELTRAQVIAFCESGRRAGCPRDQMENFWRHQSVLSFRQLQMSAAARMCDAPEGPVEVAVGGARGGGKTHWMLTQMGVDDCQRVPGLKCLMLRKVAKSAVESLQDLTSRIFFATKFQLTARGVVTFANGSKIIAGHFKSESDIDSYLGLEYDVIGVEEATTLTSNKLVSIATCCRTSKNGWRPRQYFTTNPGGVGHGYFKRRFIEPWRNKMETETRFVPSTADDNPFLNTGYISTLDKLVGWQRRAWRFGDWDIQAGQFFRNFSRDHHVVAEWNEGKARRWFGGLDYGFQHPTVFVLFCEDGDGNACLVEEHVQSGWLVPQNAKAILSILARHKIGVKDLDFIAAGSDVFARESSGRSIQRDYGDCGVPLTPADADRINGAATLTKLLGDPAATPAIAPRMFIHSRCPRSARQIPEMLHDPNRPEDVLKVDVDEDGEGGDDCYDAMRYAVQTKGKQVSIRKLIG